MINDLTALDLVTLASIAGGFLGCVFSAVISFVSKPQDESYSINSRMLRDAFLTSSAMALFAGMLTFAFGSIDVQSVEQVSPIIMFTIAFVTIAGEAWVKVTRLIFSKILIQRRNN
jgi:hypothetical protein